MKKVLFFMALVMTVSIATAQTSRQDLKGPKAKNYKPYKKGNDNNSVVGTPAEVAIIKGPKAKNQKRRDSNYTVQPIETKTQDRGQGPRYKNYRR